MNKTVLIVEHNQSKLDIITEEKNVSKWNPLDINTPVTIGGIFTEFDVENRNNRFYTASNFIPVMNQLLERKNMLGVIYGELDHPEGFDISGHNASHTLESLTYNKAENRVDGTIDVLITDPGMTIRKILYTNKPVFVSSRAAGMTGPNNEVALKELFTYDAVLDPGFAKTRQSPILESMGYSHGDKVTAINESLGYKLEEVPYRIYGVDSSYDIESLFQDNKNDKKTHRDLKYMEAHMENNLAQLEKRIIESISDSKGISEVEVKKLQEDYGMLKEELESLKKYLEFFKRNYNVLVKETKNVKKDINETTDYNVHVSDGLKNVQKTILELNEKVNKLENETAIIGSFAENTARETELAQKFIEHVAKNVKEEINITQKFTESIADETKLAQDFIEYVAKNTKSEIDITQKFAEHVAEKAKYELETTQKFAEYIANETKTTQKMLEHNSKVSETILNEINEKLSIHEKFAEYSAQEIDITQGLLEHVASEYKKDNYYIDYIASKVEGTKNYIKEELVSKLKKNGLITEEFGEEDEMEDIDSYLGLDDEQELVNSVENDIEDKDDIIEPSGDVLIDDETIENTDATDFPVEDELEDDVIGDDNEKLETQMLSALVNILGTDDTGIVMEITPDNKLIIQKSGSEETVELGQDEIEVIDTDDNIVESVAKVLDNVKKTKARSNAQPHFFTFLSESEIKDFKLLDNKVQMDIIDAMEEAIYFSEEDVLRIIGETINKETKTYTEKLIENMPERLKEEWNNMDQNLKEGYIAESKFFRLTTSSDIESYWNTRDFSKKLDSGVKMISESKNYDEETEEFSQEFIEAFRKSAMGK